MSFCDIICYCFVCTFSFRDIGFELFATFPKEEEQTRRNSKQKGLNK